MDRLNFSVGKSSVPSWKSEVAEKARMLTIGLRQHYPDDPRRVREMVIRGAREALSEVSSLGMIRHESRPAKKVRTGKPKVETRTTWTSAGLFRDVLERAGLDWSDPIAAESVMIEIQRSTAEVLGLS